MPSLLDEKSEGSGNDEPQKRASATREKKTSKTSMKTPRSPAQVEESAEVKAQKRLEAKAIHMLEDILADTAHIKENSEVVKSYIAAAKDLECASAQSNSPCAALTRHSLRRAEITLSLAQRNRKTPQDALNLHLTQLQHAHPQLELRLTHLIATEKENKRKQAEQKEVGRKEKDIARKKAPANLAAHLYVLAALPTSHSSPPRRRARCSIAGHRGSQEEEGQGKARRGGAAPN